LTARVGPGVLAPAYSCSGSGERSMMSKLLSASVRMCGQRASYNTSWHLTDLLTDTWIERYRRDNPFHQDI
jgi:hypothetical protein